MGGAGAWATVVTGEAIGALAGGLVALRFQPEPVDARDRRSSSRTAVQSVLLAVTAPFEAIAAAAALAGFAFSFGSIVWETCVQRRIEPGEARRVSAYNWMGAMAFLPAGIRASRPGRGRDRHLDHALDRRRLDRRHHARRLPRPERPRLPDARRAPVGARRRPASA